MSDVSPLSGKSGVGGGGKERQPRWAPISAAHLAVAVKTLPCPPPRTPEGPSQCQPWPNSPQAQKGPYLAHALSPLDLCRVGATFQCSSPRTEGADARRWEDSVCVCGSRPPPSAASSPSLPRSRAPPAHWACVLGQHLVQLLLLCRPVCCGLA